MCCRESLMGENEDKRNRNMFKREGEEVKRRKDGEKWEKLKCVCVGVPTVTHLQAFSSVRLLYHELLPVCIHHLVHYLWFLSLRCTHRQTHMHIHIHTHVCHRCMQTHTWTQRSTGAPWVSWQSVNTPPAYGHTLHATCLYCNMSLTLFHAENFNHNIIRQVGVKWWVMDRYHKMSHL